MGLVGWNKQDNDISQLLVLFGAYIGTIASGHTATWRWRNDRKMAYLRTYARKVCHKTTKFGTVTHWRKGRASRGHPCSIPRGEAPASQVPTFWDLQQEFNSRVHEKFAWHDNQIRQEENFYSVHHTRWLPRPKLFTTQKLTRDLFAVANLLVIFEFSYTFCDLMHRAGLWAKYGLAQYDRYNLNLILHMIGWLVTHGLTNIYRVQEVKRNSTCIKHTIRNVN